jgi:MFS family permease
MEAATSSTSVEVIVVDDSASASLRQRRIKRLFIGLALLSIIINLDGGAVPAALMHIERTFDLSIALVGLVGMLVYQGIAIGCLIVGPLLNIVSPTRATQATIILNMGATFGFGAAQSSAMLLIFRVSIGILQAIPAVYFPVWVDEFAPESSATIWMAVIQAGAPLGIMAGYVFSGILTSNAPEARCMPTDITCAWRIPFYLQSW